jgi:serine/threonine-protein phosphatase 5
VLKKAEECKEAGNQSMKNNKIMEALNKFSEAIKLSIETKKNAIYYANRAFIHTKMENYGLAVEGTII